MAQGQHTVKKDKRGPFAIVLSVIIFLMLAAAVFVYANMAIGFYGTKQSKGAFNAFDDLEKDSVDVQKKVTKCHVFRGNLIYKKE